MGAGDWILATGQVKQMYARKPTPVLVVNHLDRPQWVDLFEGNPKIIKRPKPGCQRLLNASGHRPYIAGKTDKKWTWRAFVPEPGEIYFTPEELAFAEPYRGKVMIEPQIKNIGHENKRWPLNRWQSVVDMNIAPMVQCAANAEFLKNVQPITTPSFRHACAVLSVSKAFVGHEGGLHHAAAALGIPAVVIFGGFISPQVTGYVQQKSLFTGDGLGCGMRINCQHCRDCMSQITPARVSQALREVLDVSS